MTLIAEFELRSPILLEARQAEPEVEIEFEGIYSGVTNQLKLVLWAHEPSGDGFGRALEEDPSVAESERLAEIDGLCSVLYSVTLTVGASMFSLYWSAHDCDIVWLTMTAKGEKASFTARVHDRHRLQEFMDLVEERTGETVRVIRLFDEEDAVLAARYEYDLSAAQFEALVAAYECGYFDEPRECSLADLGEDLGVSQGAVGGRLRRGTKMLVRKMIEQRKFGKH